MARRRALLAAASTLTVTASLLIPVTAANAADGDRVVGAGLPETYAITSSLMSVPAALADPADCSDWVSYDIVRDDGAYTSSAMFDVSYDDTWLLGSSDGPGDYQAVYSTGYDWNSDKVYGLDSNVMTAKFGSALQSWKGARDTRRKTVTLQVRAADYSYADYGWGPGARRTVRFERRTGSGDWVPAKTVSTDSQGYASAKVRSSTRSTWRAVLVETGSAWSATSGAHQH